MHRNHFGRLQSGPIPHHPDRAHPLPRMLVAALLAGIGITTAMADNNTQQDAEARYRQEMAACTNGQSNQDPATCKREAANALAEARRGALTTTAQANTSGNATQRCTLLPAGQREDCVARITNGDVSGSVGAGGVLREHTTIVPVPAPAQ